MRFLTHAWTGSRPLTATCLLMTVALLLSIFGLVVDHLGLGLLPSSGLAALAQFFGWNTCVGSSY